MSELQKIFRKSLNQATFQFWYRWTQDKWRFGAREFEDATGYVDVSKKWVMPEGADETSLGLNTVEVANRKGRSLLEHLIWASPESLKIFLRKVWAGELEGADWADGITDISNQLIELNPELETVKPSLVSWTDHYDLILGVTSGFNAADIKYFIERSHLPEQEYFSLRDRDIQRIEKLVRDLGVPRTLWICSPETEASIREQHASKVAGLKADPEAEHLSL